MEIQWELLFYSLLLGIAIGPFLLLALTDSLEKRPTLSKWAAAAALGTIVLAGILAFMHLGVPLHATYIFTNLGSAIGREMLITTLTGLVALVAVLQAFSKFWPSGKKIVAWVGLIAALASCFMIGMMYKLPARPMWDTWLLPITIFVSSVALGVTAAYLLTFVAPKDAGENDRPALSAKFFLWTMVAILVAGVAAVAYFLMAGSIDRFIGGDFALLFWVTIIIGIAAPVAMILYGKSKESMMKESLISAFVLLVVGGAAIRALIFLMGELPKLI